MRMLLGVLKKWIIVSYDRLGLVMICSAAWFVAAAVVYIGNGLLLRGHQLLLGLSLFALIVLALSPITAATCLVAKKILDRESVSAKDFVSGLRELAVSAWALGLVQGLVTFVLMVSIWFYMVFLPAVPIVHSQGAHVVVLMLGMVSVWVSLFWGGMMIYHFPLLVEQRPGTLMILKRGYLLTADNVGFTVGIFFVIILLTCLCLLSRFLFPLVYLGMLIILETLALRTLLLKYEAIAPEPTPGVDDDPWLKS